MTDARAPAVRTHDLAVHFGGVRAVDGIDLQVEVGETRAVIGPNGAGKTTLFNLLSGHLDPDRGTVELFGRDVTAMPPQRRSRAGVARTFQLSNLFGRLTTRENVALAVMGDAPATRRRFHLPITSSPRVVARTDELLEQFELHDHADLRVDELGHGRQRVLELAMALAGDPRVLLLDEPTAGVSRAEAGALTGIVAGLDPDLTVLVVEHDMAVAFALADRVTVMVEGRELVTGTPDEVRGNPDVVTAYLGEDGHAA
jgi:branched-chain amino acid transport system ATP-binding protein